MCANLPSHGESITIHTLPQPDDVADALRHLPEDDALDQLLRVAKRSGGWTPQLNRVGLLLLKPDAPEGEEVIS